MSRLSRITFSELPCLILRVFNLRCMVLDAKRSGLSGCSLLTASSALASNLGDESHNIIVIEGCMVSQIHWWGMSTSTDGNNLSNPRTTKTSDRQEASQDCGQAFQRHAVTLRSGGHQDRVVSQNKIRVDGYTRVAMWWSLKCRRFVR